MHDHDRLLRLFIDTNDPHAGCALMSEYLRHGSLDKARKVAGILVLTGEPHGLYVDKLVRGKADNQERVAHWTDFIFDTKSTSPEYMRRGKKVRRWRREVEAERMLVVCGAIIPVDGRADEASNAPVTQAENNLLALDSWFALTMYESDYSYAAFGRGATMMLGNSVVTIKKNLIPEQDASYIQRQPSNRKPNPKRLNESSDKKIKQAIRIELKALAHDDRDSDSMYFDDMGYDYALSVFSSIANLRHLMDKPFFEANTLNWALTGNVARLPANTRQVYSKIKDIPRINVLTPLVYEMQLFRHEEKNLEHDIKKYMHALDAILAIRYLCGVNENLYILDLVDKVEQEWAGDPLTQRFVKVARDRLAIQ